MSKNKEELKEEELKDITGARNDITIKPIDGEFWRSYNPNVLLNNDGLNNLGLLDEDSNHNVDLKKCEFKGSISNRDDKE